MGVFSTSTNLTAESEVEREIGTTTVAELARAKEVASFPVPALTAGEVGVFSTSTNLTAESEVEREEGPTTADWVEEEAPIPVPALTVGEVGVFLSSARPPTEE